MYFYAINMQHLRFVIIWWVLVPRASYMRTECNFNILLITQSGYRNEFTDLQTLGPALGIFDNYVQLFHED